MKTYRDNVECYIFDSEKLIVGKPKGWDGYIIPGGGVENTESLTSAVKREILEEFGIEVTNIIQISRKPTIIDYDPNSSHKHAQLYKGIRLVTFKADYLKDNKSLYGSVGDKYIIHRITIKEAILFFNKHSMNMKKNKDNFNYLKANHIIKVLESF